MKALLSSGMFLRGLASDLIRSSPAAGLFMTILRASLRGPGVETVVFYRSLWEDFVEILVTCCQRPLGDLAQVRVRSSGRGPGEIVSVFLPDLVLILAGRSCGDPVGILVEGPCIV